MVVHAADLTHGVKLPNLAAEVKAAGSRMRTVHVLRVHVWATALVHGAPLELRLGRLAAALLLVILSSVEQNPFETLHSAHFPSHSRLLSLKHL